MSIFELDLNIFENVEKVFDHLIVIIDLWLFTIIWRNTGSLREDELCLMLKLLWELDKSTLFITYIWSIFNSLFMFECLSVWMFTHWTCFLLFWPTLLYFLLLRSLQESCCSDPWLAVRHCGDLHPPRLQQVHSVSCVSCFRLRESSLIICHQCSIL